MFSFRQLIGGAMIAACIFFGYKFFTGGRDIFTDAEKFVADFLEYTEKKEEPVSPSNDDTRPIPNPNDNTDVIPKDNNKKQKDNENKPLSKNFLPDGTGEIVEHQYFTLAYNEKHEQAEWVAYELTRKMLNEEKNKRNDNFRPDPKVSTESALPTDYRGSGYDRGHLCPAADMAFDVEAMDETFFMSNMSPQNGSLNKGIWRELEENVRDWARKNKQLYVVTGPILRNTRGYIGKKNKISIPTAYYKVLLDYSEPEIKGIAYVIPNELRTETLDQFACTIDKVEKQTGINFFPRLLSAAQETKIEANCDVNLWRWNPNRYQMRLEKWNKE